jgi:hypothetical protein
MVSTWAKVVVKGRDKPVESEQKAERSLTVDGAYDVELEKEEYIAPL